MMAMMPNDLLMKKTDLPLLLYTCFVLLVL